MRATLESVAVKHNRRSARSRQRKMGPSDVGTCRRKSAYEQHGVKPSDPENGVGLAAIVGTWIHKGALEAMRREWGAFIETVVEDGAIRGHADALFLPETLLTRLGLDVPALVDVPTVDDLKTKRDGRMVDHVRSVGPKRAELYQTHLYADMIRRGKIKRLKRQAGLADLGPIDVQRVQLRYVARDGSGAEYPYEQEYDPDITAEAWDWIEQVESSKSPEEMPRDEDGPGLSYVCDSCPFATACWGEQVEGLVPQTVLIHDDHDRTEALAEYHRGLVLGREADSLKKKSRAMLDASDPAVYIDGDQSFRLKWSGGNPKPPTPDVEKMLDLFAEAGIEVPMKDGGRTARTISVVPYDVPDKMCDRQGCVLKAKHYGDCSPVSPTAESSRSDLSA